MGRLLCLIGRHSLMEYKWQDISTGEVLLSVSVCDRCRHVD
jgi:hypothetical protein